MRTPYGILIRFIDLGLVLLMAFLAVADLSPTIQVPLPHGTAAAAADRVYRIRFDDRLASVRPEPAGPDLCQAWSLQDLARCLRMLQNTPAPVLLTPAGAATVQRMVRVMDICHQERLACTVAP